MGKNKKKQQSGKSSYYYACPTCGNIAPYVVRYDTPVRCKFCKCTFLKDERLKIKT